MIDGRPQSMPIGHVYEINNQKQHSMMNKGDESILFSTTSHRPHSAVACSAR